MPEIQKVKIAVNTSKGNVLEENNDRYLVGMDPASNDWLFSPDETIIGEFGVLLLLADGIGNGQEGGFAASIITQTVKKLFNQTLELPPDDEGIVRLLRKFLLIAHKQLIWEQEHNTQLVYPAASAAMVLVREHKLYCIWCGNTRIYRWSKRVLQGTFAYSSDHFECISIDHTVENNQRLYKKGQKIHASDSELKPLHFLGQKENDPQISSVVLPFSKGDRVFLSTEGIYKTISDESLSKALSNVGEIESITEDLITSSFNSGAPFNLSAIILELTEGLSFANEQKLDTIEIEENAKRAFGPMVEVPEIKEAETEQRIKLKSGLKFKDKPKDPEIEPMKVRTVLPDPESIEETPINLSEDSVQTDLDFIQAVQEPKQESVTAPIDQGINSESDASEEVAEEVKPMQRTHESGIIEKDSIADKEDSLGEKRSKLRIKVTVYPDQDPVPPAPETSGIVPLEDLDNPIEASPEDALESEAPGFIDKAINDLPETDSLIDDQIEEEEFEALDEEELSEEEPEEEGPDPYIEGEELDSHIIEVPDDEDQEISSDTDESEEINSEEIIDEESEEEVEEPEQENLILTEEAEEINTETDSEELPDDELFEEPVDESEEDEDANEDPSLSKKSVTITEDWPFIEEEASAPLPLSSTEENKIEEEPVQKESEISTGIPYSAAADDPIDNNEDGNESESDGSFIESAEKNWTKIKSFWPYFLVLLALFTLPLWICGKDNDIEIPEQSTGLSEKPVNKVPEIPISEPSKKQEPENPKVNDQKPAAETKEDSKPAEKKPKEPVYDSQIQENKHQLIDEIKAMKKDMDILCKKVSTYQKNAPAGKQDRLADLVESCDQLDKKFTSIYDSRTGYLQAVRYDFLNGTIRNIKVSMEQLEKQLDIIRADGSN